MNAIPYRWYTAVYHGAAVPNSAIAANHQARHHFRKNQASGTANPSGNNPFANTAKPRHAPMPANRSATLRSSGSFRSNGRASSSASVKKTAIGASVRQKLLYAIQPALVASSPTETTAAKFPNSRATSHPAAPKNAKLSSATGSRAATSGFSPNQKNAALIQYTSGGFSNHGEPHKMGFTQSPVRAIACPIAAYLGSSVLSIPTPPKLYK